MQTFKDNKDQVWTIQIDVGSIRRVKANTGVNLLAIDQPTDTHPDAPLFTSLSVDELLLCEVIFSLLYAEKEQRGISDDDLAARFEGDVLLRAVEAFWRSLIDFFQKRGRTDTARMLTANLELIQKAINHRFKELETLTEEISKKLSLNGLESLESIRPLSHSAN